MEWESTNDQLTFGEHLEEFRKMLIRILIVVVSLSILIFCFKEKTFKILLAPNDSKFCTINKINHLSGLLNIRFSFPDYHINLISTELSSQFMAHVTVSAILACLLASPYILLELFKYISPALYATERKKVIVIGTIIYILFIAGLMMTYFVVFPISLHFLATYQVSESVTNTITIDSYITTFSTLAFMIGLVFQLPVIAFTLGKLGFINAEILKQYRAYSFIAVLLLAAIITPPDLFTLFLVAVPVWGLYEFSIWILKLSERRGTSV